MPRFRQKLYRNNSGLCQPRHIEICKGAPILPCISANSPCFPNFQVSSCDEADRRDPLDDIFVTLKQTEGPRVTLLDIRDALATYRGEPRIGEDCASCIAFLPHVAYSPHNAILLTISITFCVSIAKQPNDLSQLSLRSSLSGWMRY